MTSTLPLEILDLRHFSATQLRPILDQESRVWADRLNWDFRASADLLLQYLDSRILPGYVAVDRGHVSGYVFCVYEESKAVIGDVFATAGEDYSANDVENRLLEHLIELLQNSPGIERIESQLLIHSHAAHQAIFERAGFTIHRRLLMQLDLQPPARSAAVPPSNRLPDSLVMRRWQDNDLAAAGRLIAAAYLHHLDSEINDQYRTVAGSLRFLHNIVRFPGCGAFDPNASFVIPTPDQADLAALVLCSRVRENVGHVTQVCVASPYRGRGLATTLLRACANSVTNSGLSQLTLTVTEGNTGAVSLYRTNGFQQEHTFDAMVWQR